MVCTRALCGSCALSARGKFCCAECAPRLSAGLSSQLGFVPTLTFGLLVVLVVSAALGLMAVVDPARQLLPLPTASAIALGSLILLVLFNSGLFSRAQETSQSLSMELLDTRRFYYQPSYPSRKEIIRNWGIIVVVGIGAAAFLLAEAGPVNFDPIGSIERLLEGWGAG